MKVLRLTHIESHGEGPYCIYDAEHPDLLLAEITEMQYDEEGEEWKITVEEMPKVEFENLPEFTGW